MMPLSLKLYKPQKKHRVTLLLYFPFLKCNIKVIQHTEIPMALYTFCSQKLGILALR